MLLVGAGFALLFNLAFLAVIPLVLLGLFLKKTRGINFDISEYKKDLKNKKFLLIFAGYFFLALHFGAEDTSHALFLQKTVGLDFQQMGLVFLWIMAVIMAFTLVATKALDSGKKTRAVLLAGLVASGIGNIMYLWAFSMPMVLFSRLVHEAGDAFAILSIKAVVPDLTRMKRVGGVFGTLTFASYTGSMAGSFISGVSADIWGYAMPFALTGGALFVTALIFALLFFGGGKVIKGKKQ
jgi:MFS family permease